MRGQETKYLEVIQASKNIFSAFAISHNLAKDLVQCCS